MLESMVDLDQLRKRIDQVDAELVKLLNQRVGIALDIARVKQENNLRVFSPEREELVLKRVAEISPGPLPVKSLLAIYREIISATRSMERMLKVSYLGPPGTFTHQAARVRFGSSVDFEAAADIESVFTAVAKDQADCGVVPVENSTGGVVIETLDMFMKYDVKICGELTLEIHQNLLARCTLGEVRTVYSKPDALNQCRGWLNMNLPHVQLMPVASTTAAAELARDEDGSAAVASREAAELYGLNVLASSIEDHHNNLTRFLILDRSWSARTGKDKTSIMFAIRNAVGALYAMLLPFKKHGINLTKIESRPSRTRAWDYVFFVDFEGHAEDPGVKEALAELEQQCRYLQIMGSFPRADAGAPNLAVEA